MLRGLDGKTPLYVGALVAILVVGAAFVIGAMIVGLNEKSTPLIVTMLTSFATIVAAIIAALRADTAASQATKALDVGETAASAATLAHLVTQEASLTTALTASKVAAIQQVLEGDPCDNPQCPLNKLKGS
jgi:predicted lipid-binding transport protein (Tim44 family)